MKLMKKILFVVDKPNWAYHNIVKELHQYLIPEYEVYLTFTTDYSVTANGKNKWNSVLFNCYSTLKYVIFKTLQKDKKVFFRESNIVQAVYTKPSVFDMNGNKKNIKQFDIQVDMAYYFQYTTRMPFTATKKIVGLYTDSFPHDGPSFDASKKIDLKNLTRPQFYHQYLSHYNGLIVGSENLYNDYKQFDIPIALVNGIYKANDFKPNMKVGANEKLVIAWTGNPNREMKGFYEVIEPTIQELIKDGYKIELKTKFSGDYDELLDFYQDVDLVCICSSGDTGPSLFAEASLSNVPSISTAIGFPKMIIKHNQNGLLINRNKEELKQAIIYLYNNRIVLTEFSKRIKNDYLQKLDNKLLAQNLLNLLK